MSLGRGRPAGQLDKRRHLHLVRHQVGVGRHEVVRVGGLLHLAVAGGVLDGRLGLDRGRHLSVHGGVALHGLRLLLLQRLKVRRHGRVEVLALRLLLLELWATLNSGQQEEANDLNWFLLNISLDRRLVGFLHLARKLLDKLRLVRMELTAAIMLVVAGLVRSVCYSGYSQNYCASNHRKIILYTSYCRPSSRAVCRTSRNSDQIHKIYLCRQLIHAVMIQVILSGRQPAMAAIPQFAAFFSHILQA